MPSPIKRKPFAVHQELWFKVFGYPDALFAVVICKTVCCCGLQSGVYLALALDKIQTHLERHCGKENAPSHNVHVTTKYVVGLPPQCS